LHGCDKPGDNPFKLFARARQQFSAMTPEKLGVQALQNLKTKQYFLPISGSTPQKQTKHDHHYHPGRKGTTAHLAP
jgi:hypothetical protein